MTGFWRNMNISSIFYFSIVIIITILQHLWGKGVYKLNNKISNFLANLFISSAVSLMGHWPCGSHRHFWAIALWLIRITCTWPLTPVIITLWSGVLRTRFGGYRAFQSNLTSGWPQMSPAWHSTLNNALHSSQGFFLPTLMTIGHS